MQQYFNNLVKMKIIYILVFMFIGFSIEAQTINSIEGSTNCLAKTTSSESIRSSVKEAQAGFSGTVNLINADENIDAKDIDPLFVDATNGNFKLNSNSPAIDAGNNNLVPTGIQTDLNGNQRIYNSVVDLGCYEYYDPTGINQVNAENEIQIYSNPVTSIITITSKYPLHKIELYDLTGKCLILKSFDKGSASISIDVKQVAKGIYLLKTETATQKVIIQ